MPNSSKGQMPHDLPQVIGGFILLLLIGYGCSGSGSKNTEPENAIVTPVATPAPNTSGKRYGRTLIEQAIVDAFPATEPTTKAERKKKANASDYIAFHINRAGYLCSEPIEAQRAADTQYGIGCITHKGGRGTVNYIIEIKSGTVSE